MLPLPSIQMPGAGGSRALRVPKAGPLRDRSNPAHSPTRPERDEPPLRLPGGSPVAPGGYPVAYLWLPEAYRWLGGGLVVAWR